MRARTILALAALVFAGQALAQSGRETHSIKQPKTTDGKSLSYGRWVVDGEGDWVEAWTDNESQSEFGLLCSSDCMIYLDFRVACDEGQDYPAMINSGAGAFPISMRCHHYEKRHILITEASGDYIDMLQQGEEVGFAFPLANGLFRVSRFSTEGGYEAMREAVRLAMKSGKLKQAPKDVSI